MSPIEEAKQNIGIIALDCYTNRAQTVNDYINEIMANKNKVNYLISVKATRFSNGEGKVKILESVRGKDIYIISDIGNYSCTYTMFGYVNHIAPDEHFQDIIRTISAIGGKAKSITVIMPLLYSSRQHRRGGRESLDCALSLRQLERLGVNSIITFDAHDPNIQNATPYGSFDSIFPVYPILKKFINTEKPFITSDNTIIISPDTGAMERAIAYANILGVDVGMFYKRRDYSKIVNGKNPIIQHEYTGRDVNGKTAIIIDDMIASGDSVVDIVTQLQSRGVKDVYVIATFGFFTEGIEKFNQLYQEGILKRVYCTNGSYLRDEVKTAPWFAEVCLCKFVARIISTLKSGESLSPLISSSEKIKGLLKQMNK